MNCLYSIVRTVVLHDLYYIPVKVGAKSMFTLVDVSRVLFRGEVFSILLDVSDEEVVDRSALVVRTEIPNPNPNPNLSFRAASNISVRFDVANSLFPGVEEEEATVAGNTALSNCLLTRLPDGEARLPVAELVFKRCSLFPTIVLRNQ